MDVAPEDLSVNKVIREAVWYNCPDLKFKEQLIPLNGDDTKKIYTKNNYLPVFTLFQSDRTSNDGDSEIADLIQLAVKEALKEEEKELTEIKKFVEKHALDAANKTLQKLAEMDCSLTSRLLPEFKSEPKFDSLFKLTIRDEEVPINKRGSGVRRLILLNFLELKLKKVFLRIKSLL